MHAPPDPDPRPADRRARLRGRLFITGILLAGALGGWWAVQAGKRLAEERKARLRAPTPGP